MIHYHEIATWFIEFHQPSHKKHEKSKWISILQQSVRANLLYIPLQKYKPSNSKEQKVNPSSLSRIYFLFFQFWWLVFLEPSGVQERNVPHFKGLIDADWKSSSSRAWRQYYYPPRPLEKGHFTPKMAKGVIFILLTVWHTRVFNKSGPDSLQVAENLQF